MVGAFVARHTAHFALRPICSSDREAFFAYRSLPCVAEYQGFRPADLADVDARFRGLATEPNTPSTWFQLAICPKGGGPMVGDIGMHFLGDSAQAEVGYTLAPSHQGRGWATEALRVVLGYLFEDLGKHRVTASVDPRNARSIRLLERVGMRKEAHFVESYCMDGAWVDDCVYGILRREWPGGAEA